MPQLIAEIYFENNPPVSSSKSDYLDKVEFSPTYLYVESFHFSL